MSKKRGSRHTKRHPRYTKRTTTNGSEDYMKRDMKSFSHRTGVFLERFIGPSSKNYPDDPRYIFAGLIVMLLGIIMKFLTAYFIWASWMDQIDTGLIIIGILFIMATIIGTNQAD